MRTFIAVPMPPEVKDYLFDLKKYFKGAGVNWVHKKNLHLTLSFMGNISEKQAETIKMRLKDIEFKPFKAKLSKLGFFPSAKDPKIIWISLEPEKEIKELQIKVDQEVFDISPQNQEFKSHITIGRIKNFKKKQDFLDSIKEVKIEQLQFTINSFQFLKSELATTGPKYFTIENYESNKN